jgi:hypothetical protein
VLLVIGFILCPLNFLHYWRTQIKILTPCALKTDMSNLTRPVSAPLALLSFWVLSSSIFAHCYESLDEWALVLFFRFFDPKFLLGMFLSSVLILHEVYGAGI